jgi:hypothetical protein
MAILKIDTPAWVRQEMEKQSIPQQRTILPQSYLTQGINSPQKPGAFNPRDAQRQLDDKMSTRQDSIPAQLRQGEEVIPPEIIAKMGGRENFLSMMNEKLGPTGIQLHGGKGPVSGGQPEEDTLRGTIQQTQQGIGGMGSKLGFSSGTTGIRFNCAKGTPELSTGPTQYAGGILTNTRETPSGSIQYPRQQQARGTVRTGYDWGTIMKKDPSSTSPGSGSAAGGGWGSVFPKQASNFFNEPAPKTESKPAPVLDPIVAPPAKTQPTTQPTPTGPTAAPISNDVKGIGFQVQDITQSPYYKSQAQTTNEALQKQGAVGEMQNAQNLAQQGVGQDTAAGRTAAAEQLAGTQSKIAAADTQLALGAQQMEQSDLRNAMNMAYQSGDWGSVNKILASTGQQPIDFSNLEQQRQAGNLTGAAQTLFNLANSITGTDAQSMATKKALATEATGLLSTSLKTTLGAQYNPQALTDAVSKVSAGDISDPATAIFVSHVASAPLDWIQYSPSGKMFTQTLENNQQGKDLLTKAQSGDLTAISTLAYISTLAASNAYGINLSDEQVALLNQYGAYQDMSKLSAAERAYQEGPLDVGTTIGNMFSPGSAANNPSVIRT